MFRYILIFCIFPGYFVTCIFNPGPKYPPTKGEIWPQPQHEYKSEKFYIYVPSQFAIKTTNQNCSILSKAVDRYLSTLGNLVDISRWHKRGLRRKGLRSSPPAEFYSNHIGTLRELQINLTKPCEEYPHFDMDESYRIAVSETSVLRSDSIWGILRGLETFSQLFYHSGPYYLVCINKTEISDYPRYPHRGLLLDTGRHYLKLTTILKTLDAMAMNKMNVLHWHIVDDQCFPYQSLEFPELSEKGAFHPSMVYSRKDILMVIYYARDRGIRVMPEFDVPGHTRSWGESHPELLSKCYSNSEVFTGLGPMNPISKKVYVMLQTFFLEAQNLFPDQYFHIGGDEVESTCWSSDPGIKKFMWEHNLDVQKLHAIFIKKTMSLLSNGSKVVVWQEVFDENVPLPKDSLIQVWKYEWVDEMVKVLTAGHKVLFSSTWYLDILKDKFSDLYAADPRRMVFLETGNDTLGDNIVGGEACMWGEMADDTNVLSRSWPRASAVAEVLWSKARMDNEVPVEALHRIEEHTCRMIRRGIPAEPPSGPGFCLVPNV